MTVVLASGSVGHGLPCLPLWQRPSYLLVMLLAWPRGVCRAFCLSVQICVDLVQGHHPGITTWRSLMRFLVTDPSWQLQGNIIFSYSYQFYMMKKSFVLAD